MIPFPTPLARGAKAPMGAPSTALCIREWYSVLSHRCKGTHPIPTLQPAQKPKRVVLKAVSTCPLVAALAAQHRHRWGGRDPRSH